MQAPVVAPPQTWRSVNKNSACLCALIYQYCQCYNVLKLKQKSLDTIKAGWDDFTRPIDGQIFQHYKGGKYEIVATGFIGDTEAPCVVYRSIEKNIVWVRTAKNFLEAIEYHNVIQPRFAPVDR